MNYENIIFDVKEDTAFLTINRPPMNILNIATMKEMNDAITSLTDNKDVKVLIITSSGEKAFSAGVDVTEHTAEKVEDMLRDEESISGADAYQNAITSCSFLRSRGLNKEQISLLADYAALGYPRLKEFSNSMDIPEHSLWKRLSRIRNKLDVDCMTKIAHILTALSVFSVRTKK